MLHDLEIIEDILFLEKPVAMEQWKRLSDLADNLETLKPWRFLHEDDIFGVRDPGSRS